MKSCYHTFITNLFCDDCGQEFAPIRPRRRWPLLLNAVLIFACIALAGVAWDQRQIIKGIATLRQTVETQRQTIGIRDETIKLYEGDYLALLDEESKALETAEDEKARADRLERQRAWLWPSKPGRVVAIVGK